MDILIIAQFTEEYYGKGNGRFSYLCNLLRSDNDVELVTSAFCHGAKAPKKNRGEGWPFNLTLIDEPGYPTNVCLQRFKSHHIFGKNLKRYLSNRKVPDVIYCAIPSLSCAVVAARYCKKNGVRFIVDVQDLWPEAFKMVLNTPVISDILFSPLTFYANYAYAAADGIVAVSKTYAQRALKVNKKHVETLPICLGTDFSEFDSYKEVGSIEKPKDILWIAYIGTLGASYDISSVLKALYLINNTAESRHLLQQAGYHNMQFLLMGDGPRRAEFEKESRELAIDAKFFGYLPYNEMVGVLCRCDLAVNPIRKGAAQSLINKVGDYAAAALPVINTMENREYRSLLEEYNAGFNCTCQDPASIAEAIVSWLKMSPEQKQQVSDNSRRLGRAYFNRQETYPKIKELIENGTHRK